MAQTHPPEPHNKSRAVVDVTQGGCPGYERILTQNWNGNVKFGGSPIVPQSLKELQHIVRHSDNSPVRVVGRGHSFSPLAECQGGTLISLSNLTAVVDFIPPSQENDHLGSITVEGGATYTDVIAHLDGRGALRNLPSCPQFTVAGAVATGTHGSGVNIPNLAADISMMEFVMGDGTLVRYDRRDGNDEEKEILEGCRVHLGCLGVVSRLTLDVVPFYEVETYRYDDVPLEYMLDKLPELWRCCDSLSVWTSGFGIGHGAGHCWMTFRHFVPPKKNELSSSNEQISRGLIMDHGTLCNRQINRYCTDVNDPVTFVPTGKGPWYDALTLTLHEGEETIMTTVDLQAEFFVPLHHAQNAIRTIWDTCRDWTFSSPWGYDGEKGPATKGLVDAMEFRQVKGNDGAWLSPHPIDSLGLHISFNGDPAYRPDVMRKLPELERALEPFEVRAHWGKLADRTFAHRRIEELYGDGLQRFRELCNLHDGTGKFRNEHVKEMIFGEKKSVVQK